MLILEHVITAFRFLPDATGPDVADNSTHTNVAVQHAECQRGLARQDLRQNGEAQDGRVSRPGGAHRILGYPLGRFDFLGTELGKKTHTIKRQCEDAGYRSQPKRKHQKQRVDQLRHRL